MGQGVWLDERGVPGLPLILIMGFLKSLLFDDPRKTQVQQWQRHKHFSPFPLSIGMIYFKYREFRPTEVQFEMEARMKRAPGFTLLEIIIVIIIVSVLSSLALPRFFRLIEYSRSTEALVSISAIRQAAERCYLMSAGSYLSCANFSNLDLEDPGGSPNSHFTYGMSLESGNTVYRITATRNTNECSSCTGADFIYLDIDTVNETIKRTGGGVYVGMTED